MNSIKANCSRNSKIHLVPPHSGFSNQLSEFKNVVLMSAILNRTLIVPPILDHHAVALGSCPKFKVLSPNDLRFAVWNHTIQLLRDQR
ncbi:protein modifying enzyme [Lithospermum erythrorhizon]|uniref:Protein modifying enzyme n=1 Tax=Lithospermum erythrorhizon TaxID=34254 RepID=A0AAV3PUL7_LITER